MTANAATTARTTTPLSGSDILANARVLADSIRSLDLAAEYDRIRMLPADIVEQIRAAGIMRMNMPRIWGARRGDVFHVLWWDPEHEVWPSQLRYT